MKNWYQVRDSREEKPPQLDTTSSRTTVYERRNIHQEAHNEETAGEHCPVTEWVYEQREFTRKEYDEMQSPATKSVMQTLSGLELSLAMMEGGAV